MSDDIEKRLNYLEHAVVDLLYIARCQGWQFDYPETDRVAAIRFANEVEDER